MVLPARNTVWFRSPVTRKQHRHPPRDRGWRQWAFV